jgi:predicted  nucleic acid-binding Zn-ribbon protein
MPAITARFTADVSDFRAKLATATTEVSGFQRTASQVNSELKKFGNEFSGANVIRAAESMTKAVDQLGGVTKLTETEQRRLNSAVSEAIDKYHALGQQAPADLQKVADEVQKAVKAADELKEKNKGAGDSLFSLGGIAGKIGPAIAGAFTIGAITSFAKEVIDLGGQISDLSARTGIGSDAIQELKYAAEQTGSSIDSIVGSIEKMGIKLTEASDDTLMAVSALGLSIDDLRHMRPEDAYTAIADAVAEIQDPMRQVEIATELMGRSAAENLPAIKAGLSDLRQEARDLGQVMSKDAVEGLDALGDAWGIVIGGAKTALGEFIADIARATKDLRDLQASVASKNIDGSKPTSVFEQRTTFGERYAEDIKRQAAEVQKALDSVKAPSIFGPSGGFTPDTPSSEEQDRANQAQREAVEAAIAHQRAVKALADTWAAADFSTQLQTQAQAFGTLTSAQRNNSDITKKIVEDYGKLRQHVNASALPREMEAFYQTQLPVISGTRELIDVTGRYATSTLPDLSRRAQEARNMLAGLTAEGVIPTSRSFTDLSTQMNVPTPVGLVNIGQQVTMNRDQMSLWARETRNILGDMRQDFSGHLADMLTRQEGWKEGAVGIWKSFQRGVSDILGSILDQFINSFIKGITNALLGEQSAWSQAFAGAFGGNGGSGGGASGVTGSATNNLTNRAVNWGLGALGIGGVGTVAGTTSLAGVSGTASLAGGIGGGTFTGLGTTGATGAGAGAAGGTFGGLTTAGVLGGAAAGGAGLGLGLLGTKIFGGSGWAASGFGAGTGAATGALIGSVVPGIGTAAGAIVGGLAGAIGGWIGKSVGEKLNDARDEFFTQFGKSGTGEGSAFNALSTDLHKVQGGDKLFTDLVKADDFDELNAAVKRIVDTLGGAEFNTIKVREGFEALTKQREALLSLGADETRVLESQAGSYSLLFDTIKKTGADVPDALLPILQQMIDLGLLVDENGVKVTTLADVAFAELGRAVGEAGTVGGAALDDLNKKLDEFVSKGYITAEQADEMRQKFTGIKEGAEAVEDTSGEVDDLTQKVIISKSKAEELRQELLNQQNAHTTIEETEGHIYDLQKALQEAEAETGRLEDALRRLASASSGISAPTVSSGTPSLEGAAHGIYAWGPTPAIFGEGGEPELGGSVGFMSKALAGALRQGGASLDGLAMARYAGASSSERPIYLVADGMMLARVTNKYQPSALRLQGAIR